MYCTVQGGSNFRVCGKNHTVWPIKATEQYFPVVLFIVLYKEVQTFKSVDEILKCDHSNQSYRAVFSVVLFIMLHKGTSNFWVLNFNTDCPYWRVLKTERLSQLCCVSICFNSNRQHFPVQGQLMFSSPILLPRGTLIQRAQTFLLVGWFHVYFFYWGHGGLMVTMSRPEVGN